MQRDPRRCLKSRAALAQASDAACHRMELLLPLHSKMVDGVLFPLQGLRLLSCEYKMENVTRMVVCDLGNPMVTGTNVRE